MQDRQPNEQAREIARDLTAELIRRLGVQSLATPEDRANVVRSTQVAIEMTNKIMEAFPEK